MHDEEDVEEVEGIENEAQNEDGTTLDNSQDENIINT